MSDFDEIYRAYAAPVYRLALRAVSRHDVAEDITSEVFLAFRDQCDQVPREQLPAWLFTVAKRRCADHWRRHYLEQRWSTTVQQNDPPAHSDPEFPLETLLARCPGLNRMHRRCLVLRFRHGMSRAEIAQRVGASELQVKNQLQYALKLLRDSFEAGPRDVREEPSHDTRNNREKGISSAV